MIEKYDWTLTCMLYLLVFEWDIELLSGATEILQRIETFFTNNWWLCIPFLMGSNGFGEQEQTIA